MASSTTFKNADWIASVVGVPIRFPPPGIPDKGEEAPSDKDMGKGEPGNIIYINLKEERIPARFDERIKTLSQMLQSTTQWMNIHAGLQARDRKADGSLPTDDSDASQWKRSDYRAKVVDILLNENCTWIYPTRIERSSSQIIVEKQRFHLELLKAMIQGLAVPISFSESLEQIFEGITKLINETEKTVNNRNIWVLFQVFTYDPRRDDITASLRTISYNVTQDMITVCVGKSTIIKIDVSFTFYSTDFSFSERTWTAIRGELERWIDNIAAGNIRDPIPGGIDV